MTASTRIIGIDEWAWKKGHRYGTIVCDLERRQVIDLLPDREAATVVTWLADHPAIEIVSRDRGGGYGQAIGRALPQAMQVATAGISSRTQATPSPTPFAGRCATSGAPLAPGRSRRTC